MVYTIYGCSISIRCPARWSPSQNILTKTWPKTTRTHDQSTPHATAQVLCQTLQLGYVPSKYQFLFPNATPPYPFADWCNITRRSRKFLLIFPRFSAIDCSANIWTQFFAARHPATRLRSYMVDDDDLDCAMIWLRGVPNFRLPKNQKFNHTTSTHLMYTPVQKFGVTHWKHVFFHTSNFNV